MSIDTILRVLPNSKRDAEFLSGMSSSHIVESLIQGINDGTFDTDYELADKIPPLIRMVGIGAYENKVHNLFKSEQNIRRKELWFTLLFSSTTGDTLMNTFSAEDKALFSAPWVRNMIKQSNHNPTFTKTALLTLVKHTPQNALDVLMYVFETSWHSCTGKCRCV